ncbi:MAG: hypothetical protein E3J91_00750 [Hadesarchaea archaeon]|nr:MAG: hypothetical protein E3J91_00750 [Hadesarchaea archaeon]
MLGNEVLLFAVKSRKRIKMDLKMPRKNTMKALALVLWIGLVLSSAPALASGQDSDELAIKEVVDTFVNAINNRNADALYRCLSSQIQSEMTIDDFEILMTMLDNINAEIIEAEVSDIRITDSKATASATVTVSYTDEIAGEGFVDTSETISLVKEDGEWRMYEGILIPSGPSLEAPDMPGETPPPPEAEGANLTSDEVFQIAEMQDEISNFLQQYPDAERYASYDSYSQIWHVIYDNPLEGREYAYVNINDETGEVIEVYVYVWPPVGTNLSEDEVIEIARNFDRVKDFLTEQPDVEVDVWYSEMTCEWSVSFYGVPVEWGAEPIELPFIYVVISDATGEVIEVGPPELDANLTQEEAIDIAKERIEVQTFLANRPDAYEYAYYEPEGSEWYVSFINNVVEPIEPVEWYPAECVTVIVDDLTGEVKDVQVYRPPVISEDEAINIAKGTAEMSEFLSAHPDAEVWVWYNEKLMEWVVNAYSMEIFTEVTVFVDAETGEIKTREPTIKWEEALEIAQSAAADFLNTHRIAVFNGVYDEFTNQWLINFCDRFAENEIMVIIDAVSGEVITTEVFSWDEDITALNL